MRYQPQLIGNGIAPAAAFKGPAARKSDCLGLSYPVSQEEFAGPLHLLLRLLEKEKLDISRVNLAAIANSYMGAVAETEFVGSQSLCDFLDVATRLMAIKARFLLPESRQDAETEGEEEDEQSLLEQLERLRSFQPPAEMLKARDSQGLRTWRRQVPLLQSNETIRGEMERPARLQKAMRNLAGKLPRMQQVRLIAKPLFPLAGQIRRVQTAVAQWFSNGAAGPLSFFALFTVQTQKGEIVSAFVAVLELVRRQTLIARQERQFGDIELMPAETRDS